MNVKHAFQGFKSKIQEHADANVKEHLGLLLRKVTQQDLILGQQKQQLTSQEQKIVKQEQKISEQQRTIARLERIVGEVKKRGSTEDSTSISDQPSTADALPGTPAMDLPFEWKIERWASKLEEARSGRANSITSQPFYTGRPGYKFSISLYPNGRKEGKGTHLALYVAILKGEYDGELPWPFKGRCTVSIVDQERRDRSPSRGFNAQVLLPDASRNFDKPTTAQNEGRGWQKFISHGELMSWPHLTRHDSLLLRVECSLSS